MVQHRAKYRNRNVFFSSTSAVFLASKPTNHHNTFYENGIDKLFCQEKGKEVEEGSFSFLFLSTKEGRSPPPAKRKEGSK